jgi:hypothetical protein
VHHVGGTSRWTNDPYLNYISLRFPEIQQNRELKEKYSWLDSKKGSIYKTLLERSSQVVQLSQFIGNINKIITKIEHPSTPLDHRFDQ